MSDFPLSDAAVHRQTVGLDRATTLGVAVPDSGTWTELTASTLHSTQSITFVVHRIVSSFGVCNFSLGIGPAGSEAVIIESVPYADYNLARAGALMLTLPIPIAAGTRVAVRGVAQGTSGRSYNAYAILHGSNGAASSPRARCELIGSAPVAMASTSTLTGWIEVNALTAASYAGIVVGAVPPNGYSMNDAQMLIDIGVGAGGSETRVAESLLFKALGASDVVSPVTSGLIDVPIPAGSRVSIRGQANGAVTPTMYLHGLR